MFKKLYKYVFSFLKAVFGPKIKFIDYFERLEKCSDCSWRIDKNERSYCKSCMCPQSKLWKFSELKLKASYKYSECPRKKWER